MSRISRAFTLIELLVVIAIIAILAAILFPVFAQAKDAAKKTQTLSNAKQSGTAFAIYTTDNEDVYPIGTHFFRGAYRKSFLWPHPANWIQGWSGGTADVVDVQNSYWINAIQPYMKNLQLTTVAGTSPEWANAGDASVTKLKEPGDFSLSYNGFLHTYSATAIDAPSHVPLMWSGWGPVNLRGRAIITPELNCGATTTENCRFNPSGPPNPTGSYSNVPAGSWSGKFPIHNNTMIAVRTDTSAKSYKLSLNTGEARNTNINEPYSRYYEDGYAGRNTRFCSLGDANDVNTYYACFFRPDYDGTREKWTGIVD